MWSHARFLCFVSLENERRWVLDLSLDFLETYFDDFQYGNVLYFLEKFIFVEETRGIGPARGAWKQGLCPKPHGFRTSDFWITVLI